MFTHGEKVSLRAPEPSDLERLYEWENDTSLWHISDTIMPFSKFILSEFIDNASKDIFEMKQARFIIVDKQTKAAAGAIDLFEYDPLHRRAAVGVLIHESFRNKGFASEALKLLTRYAFNTLFLHQLYCDIPESNKNSIELFLSAGFERTGIKKHWIKREHGYESTVFLQKLNQ